MNITAIGIIVLLSLVGIIVRPFKITEAVWPLTGAVLLIIFKLISLSEGLMGIKKGIDVYLFLGGMMLLAETAKSEKLFDWLAAHAIRISKGSPKKLFFLIYLVGIIVTVFLSNDPTVVVLTPAVAVATKTAKIKYPLPFLFICAFIANAASFVLPISNPANLVIYGNFMPTLVQWLKLYFLPSFVAIASTYLMLYITQRKLIIQKIQTNIVIPELGIGGKTALIGIIATTIILLISSAYGIKLGLPTAITGLFTTSVVLLRTKKNPWGP